MRISDWSSDVCSSDLWRREAGDDAAPMVGRALAWIRSDFIYSLSTPLPGRHSVDEFLFDQQAGFCEHFSSAYVVLMRAAGIPARVATGYVGGYHNRYGDYWLVRRSDAHAWAEVWLEGRGWVRVDPTARSEEHTSELQSLMRISYAVFCLKKKKKKTNHTT